MLETIKSKRLTTFIVILLLIAAVSVFSATRTPKASELSFSGYAAGAAAKGMVDRSVTVSQTTDASTTSQGSVTSEKNTADGSSQVLDTSASSAPTTAPTVATTVIVIDYGDYSTEELSQTVYYTRTGECFHYDNPCGRGSYYPCTLKQAIEKGLRPCSRCVE